MGHLVELLLGLLVLFLALRDGEESDPYSWARNVCSRGVFETTYMKWVEQRTEYQIYYTKCGLWGWGRCRRRRSWRTFYYKMIEGTEYRTRYECCSGWSRSGRYCSIPICSRGCSHGRCISPNTCSCSRGWEGSFCQYDVNECSRYPLLNDCSQLCINTPGSYKCGCKKGYVLDGLSSCKDEDECATNNGQCDHMCKNTHGSYRCRCFLGYKLLPDGRTCLASDEVEFPVSLVPTPTVTYRNESFSKLQMLCSFDFPVWNNVSYLVEWYANSIKPVKNDTWCIPEEGERTSNHSSCARRQSVITLSRHFAIGDTVWCKLYIMFSPSSNNNWAETGIISNQFYVGIEVSPRHVIVDQCDVYRMKNVTVILRPTVPILPFMNLPGTDNVIVYVMIPEKTNVSVDKCNVELRTEDMTHGKKVSVDGICEKANHTYFFHFKPETSSPHWFSGVYQMPSMKVTTHPKVFQYGECSHAADVLITFDSRVVNFRSPGVFVMYTNDAQKVQVQIRFVSIARGHKSLGYPCGVAIKEGKNVLVLSNCDELVSEDEYPIGKKRRRKMNFLKRSPGILSEGIHIIKKNRREHKILLMSGLEIVARIVLDGLRITIRAPITDKGKVSGLCGNFNGNKYDDFKDRHRLELKLRPDSNLRIPEDKSYFKVLPPQEEEESKRHERYCFCSIINQVQTKMECSTTETHFAKIDENERHLMTKNFKNAFGWLVGQSSDCANKVRLQLTKDYFSSYKTVLDIIMRSSRNSIYDMIDTRLQKRCGCIRKHINKLITQQNSK